MAETQHRRAQVAPGDLSVRHLALERDGRLAEAAAGVEYARRLELIADEAGEPDVEIGVVGEGRRRRASRPLVHEGVAGVAPDATGMLVEVRLDVIFRHRERWVELNPLRMTRR